MRRNLRNWIRTLRKLVIHQFIIPHNFIDFKINFINFVPLIVLTEIVKLAVESDEIGRMWETMLEKLRSDASRDEDKKMQENILSKYVLKNSTF